jgi:hypothetical protein
VHETAEISGPAVHEHRPAIASEGSPRVDASPRTAGDHPMPGLLGLAVGLRVWVGKMVFLTVGKALGWDE